MTGGIAKVVTLLGQLIQSLGEGQHHMGGRGKAPLAVLFHSLPLVQQIQREGAGLAFAGQQLVQENR